jgi:prepilin-type N-terminal cleavage/methylation domain-containing protein
MFRDQSLLGMGIKRSPPIPSGTVRPARSHAFTLIELLVVIAIIAILAGMLMPALGRSKAQSLRIKCINNQHQVGLALQMYADDYNSFYPIHGDWGTLGGRTTNGTVSTHNSKNEKTRPLNIYAGSIEVFHCPADRGDPYWPIAKTCWDGWGNSYLPMWAVDWFRTKHVTGDSTATPRTKEATPMKTSEIAQKASTKLVQGDWLWQGSRDLKKPQGQWHNYKGKRVVNMLYGDSHAESYLFPKEMDNWINSPPPDINFRWW